MFITININYRDTKPIYEQIKDQLRRLVVSGAIKTDEKLPSIRELASSLAINPNTIARAYKELEAEGYVYSVSGRGSFASSAGEAKNARKDFLLTQLDEIVRELHCIGMDENELISHLERGDKK